jgi:hypothetical protein
MRRLVVSQTLDALRQIRPLAFDVHGCRTDRLPLLGWGCSDRSRDLGTRPRVQGSNLALCWRHHAQDPTPGRLTPNSPHDFLVHRRNRID